ncbi:MAG: hypothetical protein AB8B69_21805 [Chitinophagales bacterium]
MPQHFRAYIPQYERNSTVFGLKNRSDGREDSGRQMSRGGGLEGSHPLKNV